MFYSFRVPTDISDDTLLYIRSPVLVCSLFLDMLTFKKLVPEERTEGRGFQVTHVWGDESCSQVHALSWCCSERFSV